MADMSMGYSLLNFAHYQYGNYHFVMIKGVLLMSLIFNDFINEKAIKKCIYVSMFSLPSATSIASSICFIFVSMTLLNRVCLIKSSE